MLQNEPEKIVFQLYPMEVIKAEKKDFPMFAERQTEVAATLEAEICGLALFKVWQRQTGKDQWEETKAKQIYPKP